MAEYTIAFTDPSTGKVKRGTFSSKKPLSERELAQVGQLQAEKAGVSPESVKVGLVGDKEGPSPGEWTGKKEGVGPFKMATKVGRVAADVAPFGLGLINPGAATLGKAPAIGAFLAKHPQITGAALRSLAAVPMGAVSGALEGKDPVRSGVTSGVIQGGLEAIIGPASRVIPRIGGGKITAMEDKVANEIMTRARAIVPWWKGLKDSHQGLRELAEYGEGQALLSKHYGSALADVKALVSPEEKMVLSVEDARALKIPDANMEPIVPTSLNPQDFKAMKGGKATYEPTQVNVPTHLVIDKVQGVGGRDHALAQRTVDAIDQTLPDVGSEIFKESRRLYREGKSIINGLKDMNVIDENTKRLNLERLSKGSATLDEQGQSIWERSVKGPESKKMFRETIPEGKAPHRMSPSNIWAAPSGHVGIGTHSGEPVTTTLRKPQPSTTWYSGNIPATSTEDAVKRWLPGLLHGAPSLYSTVKDALTADTPKPPAKEGATP